MSLEIYVLTHNNLFCAEYQIKTIRKFCMDRHRLVLIDSNCGEHREVSSKLEQLCQHSGTELLKLPDSMRLPDVDGSERLGRKWNFVFETYIKKRKPKYFGIMDQDMFMFEPFTVIDQLEENGMWGDIIEVDQHSKPFGHQERPWAMHPWLSFFKYDFVKDEHLDWRPCTLKEGGSFDTGGRLWLTFISKKKDLKDKSVYWLRDNISMTYPFKEVSDAGPPGKSHEEFVLNGKKVYGQIQINNGFIHMINSANHLLHPKVAYVKGFLDSRLIS